MNSGNGQPPPIGSRTGGCLSPVEGGCACSRDDTGISAELWREIAAKNLYLRLPNPCASSSNESVLDMVPFCALPAGKTALGPLSPRARILLGVAAPDVRRRLDNQGPPRNGSGWPYSMSLCAGQTADAAAQIVSSIRALGIDFVEGAVRSKPICGLRDSPGRRIKSTSGSPRTFTGPLTSPPSTPFHGEVCEGWRDKLWYAFRKRMEANGTDGTEHLLPGKLLIL
jgi:hypothetical protein